MDRALLALCIVGGVVISFITFINSDFALSIIIFSMLLSPEIPVIKMAERDVVIRIDDILLIFMFFSWLAKVAINKEFGLLKWTPINLPLGIYVSLCVVVTGWAMTIGINESKFLMAFFFLLKYMEYLMLFYLVANNLKSIRQCKMFTVFFFITCFIVCVYGYAQISSDVWRVSAPFEGEKTEPNTLAGYFVIIFSLIFGLFIHNDSRALKLLLCFMFFLIFPVFLFTLSRGGYVAFFAMYLSLIIFTKKKRNFLIILLLISALVVPFVLPQKVTSRIKKTFVGKSTYEVMGSRVSLEGSAAARLEVWNYIYTVFSKSPLFGYGVKGIRFVDTQYGLILGELGIVGLMVFAFLFNRLIRASIRIYRASMDDYVQSISLGFLSSIFALLILGTVANVFIIVRIMEPFWFIAAMVLISPSLVERKHRIEEEEVFVST